MRVPVVSLDRARRRGDLWRIRAIERRLELGLTITELAGRVIVDGLAVGPDTVHRWEAGHRTPMARQRAAWAAALGLPVTELMTTTHLRALREAAGLTMQQVAELVGVAASLVHYWEAGATSPDDAHLAALAKALGCSVSKVLAHMPPRVALDRYRRRTHGRIAGDPERSRFLLRRQDVERLARLRGAAL